MLLKQTSAVPLVFGFLKTPTRFFVSKNGRLSFLFFFILTANLFAAPPGYNYHKVLTTQESQITAGTGNLFDFPVLVRITDNDLRHTSNGGYVENISGYDIIFTSSDGNTVIPHQVELYDPTIGQLIAWVKVPVVSSTVNTDFYIYFGNNTVTTDPSTSATWNSGYVGVWHLHNDLLDATANGINLTNVGPTLNEPNAVIASGQDIETNQSLTHPVNPLLQITGNVTLETWVNFETIQANAQENVIFAQGLASEAAGTNYCFALTVPGAGTTGNLRMYWEYGPGTDYNSFSTASTGITTGAWHHIAAVRDVTSMNVKYYYDGVLLGTPVTFANAPNSSGSTTLSIGRDLAATTRDLDADLDEARISNVVRAPEWVQATYQNTRPGSTFLTVSETRCVFSDFALAGPDQLVCTNTATLAGNTLTYGTGMWTLVSGAGTILSPSSPTSTVTGLGAGPNIFVWTVTNSPFPPCSAFSDTVVITFDNTAPVVICPPAQNIFVGSPCNFTLPDYIGMCTITDNCGVGGLTITQTPAAGAVLPLGTTNVTVSATDANGNTGSCTFAVNVIDNTPPVFASCPLNISVLNNPGACGAIVSWAPPVAVDNCSAATVTFTSGFPSGSFFPIGTTTVTYTATDAAGNSSTCSFTVTVTDATTPVFTSCPASITIPTDPGQCTAIATWTAPTATDNCPGLLVSQTAGLPSGSAFPIGVTTISFLATDVNGNSVTCSFNVTVIETDPPVFAGCPLNITVPNTPGVCTGIATWTAPTATDNCPGVTVTQTAGPVSGSTFPPGVTNIVYTATDVAGNTATCSFTVTVVDNQPPVFSFCPSNITVVNTPGLCGAVVNWVPPVATDNCPGVTITQTTGLPSGSFFPIGTSNIVFEASDAAGNVAACSFSITVTDAEIPVFTSCPANITMSTAPGMCDAPVNWINPTASDNCAGVTVTQSSGLLNGSNFPPGVTTVSYTATDAVGNTATCSFTVTINDNEPPIFTSCPPNIVVSNTPGTCGAAVSWVTPVVTENCPGLVVAQTSGLPSGSVFPIGTTFIVYTATDAAGNVAYCSFSVTVNDNEYPVFSSCPLNITASNSPGSCSAVVNWPPLVASDNCAGMAIFQTAGLPSGSAFPVGVTNVAFTAADVYGNSTTCSFTVTVNDVEAPVFSSCPSNITTVSNPGMCGALVSWTAPVAIDNCSPVTITQTAGPASGSLFPVGVTNVAFSATDADGNVGFCSFTVTVTDGESPTFTSCPSNISVNNNPGLCSAVVSWIAPVASDNCGGVVVNQTAGLPPGSVFPIGTTSIIYTATDAVGNVSACNFTVTVTDNQAPVFTSCPGSISVSNNPGVCGAVVNWPLPNATDNCGGLTVTQTSGLAPGSVFPVGTSTVTYTATDASGNTSNCSFTVTVTDMQAPTFTSCPSDISINSNPGLCSAVVTWVSPAAADNCPGTVVTQTAGLPSGSAFPIGVTTVSYTATDAYGNSSVCSFTVTVADNQVPVFTSCPSSIIVNVTPGLCSSVVNWVAPVATDNCPGVTITQTSGLPSGSSFPIGVTNITYTALDANGNTSTCTFAITIVDNQPPFFVSCPANITLNNAFGLCGAVATWPAPVASDNCGGVSMLQTSGPVSGSTFPIGVTTIGYTATDAVGNSTVCTFTVTVVDSELPTFSSCPANITAPSNPGFCNAVVSWIAPTASDNCPGVTIAQTIGPASGSTFPVGTTTISYTATDASGNNSVCSFTVTVNDDQPPVFTSCPGNISVNNTPGSCSAVVSWTAPTVTDNCSGVSFVQTAGLSSGSAFPIGTTNIVYTATDASGNTSNCTFTVTVTDNQLPVFTSCPVDITTNNNPGICGAIVNWVAPAASDNCPGVTVIQTLGPPSGSVFPVGTTNVSYTATDAYGNVNVCSFSVTVTDIENPVFTSCPSNILVNSTPGLCSAVVNWIAPTATDNCAGVVLSQTAGLPSGSSFPTGVTTIVYTATDIYGHTSTCSFTVTVVDVQIPIFTSCPSSISVNTTPGLCNAFVSWVPPFASDNCPGLVLTQTTGLPSGSAFPIGITPISYTATDASGNTAVCSFTVTVSDNQAPVFTSCPANISVSNTTGTCSAVVSWAAPMATDNCSGLVITQTAGFPSGSSFPIGTTTISYTATDASGNNSVCSFTVTVEDNELPVFTSCPADITVNSNSGVCGANVTWAAPSASDNCAGLVLTQTTGLPSGSLFPIGITNVSYLAVDASGNTATCSFTVTVVDNQVPVFTSCPGNITINNTPGLCSAVVSWAAPVATDNCSGVSVAQTAGPISGSAFPIGTTTVTFTASDSYGNTSICSFTVTVVDNEFPVFASCPLNITTNNTPGSCSAVVAWAVPTATDNCGGMVLTQTSGLPSGSAFPIGITNIVYTATDASGNVSTCAFTVTVTDNESPVFTSCPANIAVNNTPGTCGAIVFWPAPAATDNCSGLVVTQTAGLPSGSNFPIGITNVSYMATDAYGNTASCSFTVTVTDNQLPEFTSCPVNIVTDNTPGVCGAVVSWTAPAATDNCPGLLITQTAGLPSGSTFPVGTTLITFVAADASGNTATCSFSITVNDVQAPTFTSCPVNITVNASPGSCDAVVSWVSPIATDNCSGITLNQTAGLSSGSSFPIGTTNISYSAVDASGNTSICSFTVTVTDNQFPVFSSCPASISVNNTPGSCFANVSWVAPVATDNCMGLVVTQTAGLPSGSAFPIGITTNTFTATDASGNVTTCSFTVTVIDNQAPVFASCPSDIVLNNNVGLCSAIASWVLPTATDNCSGLVVNQTTGLPNGSAFPIGITTVTYVATDASGNTAACSFTVTVTDNQAPVFVSCPLNIITNTSPGVCSAVVSWAAPSATDNCPGVTVVQTLGPASGSTFPTGVTNISYTATDANGNSTVCAFSVTVLDNQAPEFLSCPTNINLNTTPGSCEAVATWSPPVANDNCSGLVSIVQTSGLPSGSAFPLGVTPVIFTATDAVGNVSTCTFNVTVSDNQAPVFTSCPANIIVSNDVGVCGAVVNWVAPVATDNCSGVIVTQTGGLPSGSLFPLGTTNISYTALDAGGNSVICSFTVTVNDNQVPTFTSCPANISINNNPGLCSAVVSWVAPAVSDNCLGTTIVQTAGLPSGSAFPMGVTTNTFTAIDAAGNSTTCSFTVTVTDNEFPVFTSCPANISVNATTGLCGASVSWAAPIAVDNCTGMTLIQTAGLPSGATFPIGVTTVEFTATDAAGNVTLCSFTVTVTDNQFPVFTSCPVNISVNNSPGACSAVVSWIPPTATDNCTGLVLTQTAGLPSGSAFPIGVTTNTYTATDASGNVAVCTFTVTVADNEFPVFTSCPGNINVANDPGSCNAVVSWIAPAASDNCPGTVVTQTAGLSSGSAFPIGTTNISYTATDASGNVTVCSFTVTVSDSQFPVFTSCPSSISVNNNPGLCSAIVSWIAPTATDNCAGVTVVQTAGLPPGSAFPVGVTINVYTATDAAGNSVTCSFTVTVTDNQFPVFTSCPANITVNNDPGICGAIVTWTAPAVTDNCPGTSLVQTAGFASGSVFPVGVSTITYTATDAAGNVTLCSFTVTVNDNQPPVFVSCPSNISVNNAPGMCSQVVGWPLPAAIDNCGGAVTLVQTMGLPSGSSFPIGVTNISYNAIDAAGNISVCAFTVTVTDNELPVFSSCPSSIVLSSTPGICSAVASWTAPVAMDNCPGVAVTQTAGLPSGSVFPVGVTTVSYNATDASGNTTVCTFTVTVNDNQPPIFTSCPSTISVINNTGLCGAIVSWSAPLVSDNCSGVVITQTSGLPSGSVFPVGTTTVTFVATDAGGNTASCTFNVIVTDNENPGFVSCPANISVPSNPGLCSAVVNWVEPVASDNCAGVSLIQTTGPANGSTFPLGVTNISYTATDAAGNTSVCAFTITVTDAEAPVFTTCPGNINVNSTIGSCNAVVSWALPSAMDNCPGTVTILQTAGLPSGSSFPIGVTNIVYTATDANGNVATCSFTVTVNDNEAPVFTSCPSSILVNNNPGSCSAVVSWIAPSATDNCAGLTLAQTAGLPNGSAFPVGVTTVTYTATDAVGNTSLCSFTVTVIDNQLPVFTSCPADIVVNNTPGSCTAVVNWIAPSAIDNCSGAVITLTAGLPSGSSFPVGTTLVTFTATDASGNMANCSFTVTVNDVQPPVFVSCPGNITVNNDPGNCSAIVNWVAPSATDNCSGVTVTQTAGLPNGSVFPLGVTNIVYTATDASGLSVACSFSVTVTDNQAPIFTSCPSNITVNNTPGLCSGVASWTPPAATDNCTGVVTITQTSGLPSGSVFPIGTTVITYTAADVLGNTSVCSFTVTVVDAQVPLISGCPSNIAVTNTPGSCGTLVNWIAPTATDNCPGVVLTQTTGLPNGSVFPVGVTTITYSATDAAGNISLCVFTVTVSDVQPPVFTSCPLNIVTNNNPGVCGATVAWPAPTANDNCPGLVITQTSGLVSGSVFPIGTTNVSFTATDASGNTAVCAFTVTVNDVESPVFASCPSNISVNNNPGLCGAVVSWMPPSATDNCSGVSIVQTAGPSSGSTFPIGVTNISFTATDASANTAVCNFTVTVTDNQLPVFTLCPPNISVNNDPGMCNAIVNWVPPVANDNCTGTIVTQTTGLPNGSSFPIGTTNVAYTATDASGNSSVCSFTVTVNDNEVPVFSSCPANITVNNNPGLCSAVVSWVPPVATDNCVGMSVSQTSGLPSGSSFPVGTSVIVYTAIDAAGNTSTCSFTITVIDNEIPVFVSCPSNITSVNDAGLCGAIITWAIPTASDNCSGLSVTQTAGPAPGSVFPIGITTVTYTATDAGGNAVICSFTVTVTDNELPVFSFCPADISTCIPVVSFTAPVASDNCPGVVMTQTSGFPSGTTFPLGTTTVEFTATDAAGNIQTCQFDVTVVPPVLSVFTPAMPDTLCVLETDLDLVPMVSPNIASTDSFSVSGPGVIPAHWSFSPSLSGVGTYTITHYVTNGVCSDFSSHTVAVVPVANAAWTYADTICEAAGPITLTPTGDPGGVWMGPGVTGNTFDPVVAGPGSHTISYVVGFGICKDTLARSIFVRGDVDPTWAFPSLSLCTSSPPVLLDNLVTGDTSGTWSGAGVLGNIFDPSALSGPVSVTYTVGESFCAESLTQSVTILVLPVTFAGNDTAVCGLTDTLNALPLMGNGVWSSLGMDPNISFADVNDAFTTVTSTIEGTFGLVWSESVGGACVAYDTVYVTFWQPPVSYAGPDQTIEVDHAVLNADVPVYGTGVWIVQNAGPVVTLPGNPGSTVTNLTVGANVLVWSVTNGTCPPADDDVLITVNDVVLPEAISPNGDGLNDVWVIGGISNLQNELIVFNRWGEEVYRVKNYQNDWAGTKSNGAELPNDTYFYVLKVEGYDDFSGYIIIKR